MTIRYGIMGLWIAVAISPARAQSVSDADLLTARHACLAHMFAVEQPPDPLHPIAPRKWPRGWEHCEDIEIEVLARQKAVTPSTPDESKVIADKLHKR